MSGFFVIAILPAGGASEFGKVRGMELNEIIRRIDAVPISDKAIVTQLKREEDGEPYQVWKLDCEGVRYILKEAKESEAETYGAILAALDTDCVPTLYQTIAAGEKTFLLMEYAEGGNLCRCDRARLALALDALISLQQQTWNSRALANRGYSFDQSLRDRRNRGLYLNDPLLEKAYRAFMAAYETVPRTLCHDDLLPFNIIASDNRAVLIDWEFAGILPYPTSFARLIAHGEDNENAFFYMSQEDRSFATAYYYEKLLREKGISYEEWRSTLERFLFYEYCEWVFVGNKYGDTGSEYYKKYLPIARRQAEKISSMESA